MKKNIIIILIMLSFIILPVIAGSNANNSTIISDNSSINKTISNIIIYPYYPQYRMEYQGQDVYINDTVDISGQGWAKGIAWYGMYGQYSMPQYIREFTPYKSDQRMFYVDPSIFLNRTGKWYQYYGNETEPNGNLLVFNVVGGYRNNTITYSNGSVITISIGMQNETPQKDILIQPLEEIKISDYLVSKGDALFIDTDGPSKVWILNDDDRLFALETKTNNITINSNLTNILNAGTYNIIIHKSGKNTIYEVGYKDNQLTSPWKDVPSIDIIPVLKDQMLSKFKSAISMSDDTYEIKKLVVENPLIEIKTMDEVGLGSREVEFKSETGIVTMFDIRGYTNFVNNTELKVILDKDEHNSREIKSYTITTNTIRTSIGNKSMFQVYYPIIWDNMKLGMHTITVIGPHDTFVNADFPVQIMPANSYRPNASFKYSGSSNPWVPTPTPEIIKVIETKEIIKIKEVIKEVPPSNETVYEQQRIAQQDIIYPIVFIIGIMIIGIGILYFGGRYAISVIRRL